MALFDERSRERLQHLFAGIGIEPEVSYSDIIDAVRSVRPPETVWGLARDLATHLETEPDAVFPPRRSANYPSWYGTAVGA